MTATITRTACLALLALALLALPATAALYCCAASETPDAPSLLLAFGAPLLMGTLWASFLLDWTRTAAAAVPPIRRVGRHLADHGMSYLWFVCVVACMVGTAALLALVVLPLLAALVLAALIMPLPVPSAADVLSSLLAPVPLALGALVVAAVLLGVLLGVLEPLACRLCRTVAPLARRLHENRHDVAVCVILWAWYGPLALAALAGVFWLLWLSLPLLLAVLSAAGAVLLLIGAVIIGFGPPLLLCLAWVALLAGTCYLLHWTTTPSAARAAEATARTLDAAPEFVFLTAPVTVYRTLHWLLSPLPCAADCRTIALALLALLAAGVGAALAPHLCSLALAYPSAAVSVLSIAGFVAVATVCAATDPRCSWRGNGRRMPSGRSQEATQTEAPTNAAPTAPTAPVVIVDAAPAADILSTPQVSRIVLADRRQRARQQARGAVARTDRRIRSAAVTLTVSTPSAVLCQVSTDDVSTAAAPCQVPAPSQAELDAAVDRAVDAARRVVAADWAAHCRTLELHHDAPVTAVPPAPALAPRPTMDVVGLHPDGRREVLATMPAESFGHLARQIEGAVAVGWTQRRPDLEDVIIVRQAPATPATSAHCHAPQDAYHDEPAAPPLDVTRGDVRIAEGRYSDVETRQAETVYDLYRRRPGGRPGWSYQGWEPTLTAAITRVGWTPADLLESADAPTCRPRTTPRGSYGHRRPAPQRRRHLCLAAV